MEYIYSMGMGELELDLGATSSSHTDTTSTTTSSSSQPSRRNSLVKLKQTAQLVELYDLARLAELLLEREPLPPPPPPPPAPINNQNHNNNNNNTNNHIQNYQQQQQLSQIYTNLMIEQLLKKLYRGEQTSSPIAELVQQTVPQPPSQPRAGPLASLNTRFASLFNKSKLDLARFEADFELDTISRDLVIKDKYVYPSQDVTPTFLDACFENSVLINLDLPEPGKRHQPCVCL